MSFTADELQALNDIFEAKLTAQQRAMEQAFDQRLSTLRREVEQRLIGTQQEIVRTLAEKLAEQQRGLQNVLMQQLSAQQMAMSQGVGQEMRQRQQQLAHLMDAGLANQLEAIKELNERRVALQRQEGEEQAGVPAGHFDGVEVQTDLDWEDLVDTFGKALDGRFVALMEMTQATLKSWERSSSVQLEAFFTQLREEMGRAKPVGAVSGNLVSMEDVFLSIEQLERIIESMQVAMTANHALLSNRLYQHQQLPPNRGHRGDSAAASVKAHPNGTGSGRSLEKEKEREHH